MSVLSAIPKRLFNSVLPPSLPTTTPLNAFPWQSGESALLRADEPRPLPDVIARPFKSHHSKSLSFPSSHLSEVSFSAPAILNSLPSGDALPVPLPTAISSSTIPSTTFDTETHQKRQLLGRKQRSHKTRGSESNILPRLFSSSISTTTTFSSDYLRDPLFAYPVCPNSERSATQSVISQVPINLQLANTNTSDSVLIPMSPLLIYFQFLKQRYCTLVESSPEFPAPLSTLNDFSATFTCSPRAVTHSSTNTHTSVTNTRSTTTTTHSTTATASYLFNFDPVVHGWPKIDTMTLETLRPILANFSSQVHLASSQVQIEHLHADQVAVQLTLVDYFLFIKILPQHFLRHLSGDTQSSLRRSTDFFNYLTRLIESSILESADVQIRSLRIQSWVKVGMCLLRLRNFHTLKAVTSALTTPPIVRLKKTWLSVPRKVMQNFHRLKKMVSEEGNFETYRKQLLKTPRPLIPFLGILQHDFTYMIVDAKRRGSLSLDQRPDGGARDGTDSPHPLSHEHRIKELLFQVEYFQSGPSYLNDLTDHACSHKNHQPSVAPILSRVKLALSDDSIGKYACDPAFVLNWILTRHFLSEKEVDALSLSRESVAEDSKRRKSYAVSEKPPSQNAYHPHPPGSSSFLSNPLTSYPAAITLSDNLPFSNSSSLSSFLNAITFSSRANTSTADEPEICSAQLDAERLIHSSTAPPHLSPTSLSHSANLSSHPPRYSHPTPPSPSNDTSFPAHIQRRRASTKASTKYMASSSADDAPIPEISISTDIINATISIPTPLIQQRSHSTSYSSGDGTLHSSDFNFTGPSLAHNAK